MIKRIIKIVLALSLVISCAACNSRDNAGADETEESIDQGTTAAAEALEPALFRGGTTEFKIIRPDVAEEYEKDGAVKLRAAIEAASGAKFELATDWSREKIDTDPFVEILIGNTNRPESAAALETTGKKNSTYAIIGNKLVINGGNEVMFTKAIDSFIEDYLASPISELLVSDIEPRLFETSMKAEYIGEEFEVTVRDQQYAGGQFIAKLFTEGLGRGPEASEFKEYYDVIYTKLFSEQTLSELSYKLFSSEDYKALGLSDREAAFAVYRAVLNRDPTEDEANSFKASESAESAKEFALGEEFSRMKLKIRLGSYGWGVNNTTAFTGTKVYTADDINAMLAASDTVELEQGALVLCDKSVTLSGGKTLMTSGNPTNYLKMARFIRTGDGDYTVVDMQGDGISVRNIWVDGNRSGVGVTGGQNVCVCGYNMLVEGCKMSDTSGPTNMSTVCVFTGIHVKDNLITCYTSSNVNNWADGITHQGRGIIENNTIIDATDVGIVVFRDWTGAPQDSIIRNNKVIAAGNSCFAAYHIDAWYNESTMNFDGCVFYENQLWTTMTTHFNLCLSAASSAWHNNSNEARGAAFYNNYTPDGVYAVCGIGLASDSMNDVTLRGNQLKVYITDLDTRFGSHLIVFNDAAYDGDVQEPYDDAPLHNESSSYIGMRTNANAARFTYREGVIYEDKITLPESITNR